MEPFARQASGRGEIPLVRTEASEAASEAAFALLDALWRGPSGLAVLDRDLRFVQVNEVVARATDIPAADHVGRTLGELFGGRPEPFPQTIARAEEAMRRVLASGRAVLSPIAWVLPGGRRRHWACSIYPVVGPSRAVRGVCAVIADATDDRAREAEIDLARERAELSAARLALLHDLTAALSAARDAGEVARSGVERLREALGASAAALFRVDGAVLRLAAQIGFDEEAALPESVPLDCELPECLVARERCSVWLETPAAISQRFPRAAEAAFARGRGAWLAVPLSAGGAAVGALTLAFGAARPFDLEERALVLAFAEECAQALDRISLLERERAARAEAERSRALLDAVVDNAPIGLALMDRDLRFVCVNPLLADMNGLSPREHVGRTAREILPGLPLDEVERAWREIVRTGRPLLDQEVRGETPAAPGKKRTWLESWYPVTAGGEILGIGSVVREITAEREAEEFRRNVLGIVGHDLRSPLSALVLSARVLVRTEALSPRGARIAARIFATAGRMDRIINVLLDYARLRAGQGVPLDRRRCYVGSIVEGVADECEASHPGRVVRRSGEGDGSVEWDPDRIAQALANLTANGLDHGPPGEPVDIVWRAGPNEVSIEVSNGGPPIPPEVLARLFEPFRRAERERPGGLGLGLFIARAVAVAHGGEIEARSAEGRRTAFTMRLPRSPP